MLTMRHLSHFAGARSLHQALTQELPHWALVQRSALRAGVPLQAYRSQKTSYRHHRGQFSALWTWATLTEQLVPPQHNRDVLLPTLDRTRQPSLQAQAGDPISEVQNFSGLEEEVSCPHLHN